MGISVRTSKDKERVAPLLFVGRVSAHDALPAAGTFPLLVVEVHGIQPELQPRVRTENIQTLYFVGCLESLLTAVAIDIPAAYATVSQYSRSKQWI